MEYVPFRMNQAANTGTGQMTNCSKHHFVRLTQGDCVFCLRENATDLEGQLDEARDEIERLRWAIEATLNRPIMTESLLRHVLAGETLEYMKSVEIGRRATFS